MKIRLDLKNYNENQPIFKRTASRAIIRRGNEYLLVFSKYGDYKFPGGGVEDGESLEQAVIREVAEETGYVVIPQSIRYFGEAFERRNGIFGDIMEMRSHYFLCEVSDGIIDRKLDDYEEEYDYRVVWLSLEKAIERNKSGVDLEKCPWVTRELAVMEVVLSDLNKRCKNE